MHNQRPELTVDAMGDDEVGLLTRLMAAAFDADAPAELDHHLLDCYHRSDFFVRLPPGCFEAETYTLHVEAAPAGGAVIWHFAAYDAVLGLYFIAPAFQHHGIGREGWRLIEARYPEVRHWAVAAPRWSPATLRFYERQCGFCPAGGQGPYLSLVKDLPDLTEH
jgi:GNAT superfamily N-acetyltransferase